MEIEKFTTIAQAIKTIRQRIWGQETCKGCKNRWNIHGACQEYKVQIGHVVWILYCDNIGRFTSKRGK